MAPTMRRPARFWLNLTQLVLLVGCSGRLPLDINGSAPDRQKLPVELAGNGSDEGWRGAAGASGRWRGGSAGTSVMPQPGQEPSICGDRRIQPTELCDGPNLNGHTCASLGYNGGGSLFCNATTCNFDTIMCRMSPGQWGTPPPVTEWDAGTDDAGN